MKMVLALSLIVSALAVPARAQGPMTETITEVRTVFVPKSSGAGGFDAYLADSLRAWGQWRVVTDPQESHDADLVGAYGCNPFSFRYQAVSKGVGWTVCEVDLLDSDLLERHVAARPIWSLPFGKLEDLYARADPEDFPTPARFKLLADGVVSQLRDAWEVASGKRQPEPPLSPADVRWIYVAMGDFSKTEDVDFEKQIAASLMARDRQGRAIGDCKQGYASIVPGVRLLCRALGADAILVSSGPRRIKGPTHVETQGEGTVELIGGSSYDEADITFSEQSEIWDESMLVGGAWLYDPRAMAVLWSTDKNGTPTWAKFTNALLGARDPSPDTPEVIAKRIAKQLARDIEKAKRHAR